MATVRAVTSFALAQKVITVGTRLDASDPIVAKYPTLFVPVEGSAPVVVEQATAAPGEQRATPVRRPRKKAAAK